MAPRFDDLPLEILVNITSHMTTIDYGSVRRTCSTVEKKLFDSFGKDFFKRKQFMLTRASLQTLIDISNHEAIRVYLTKVIIGTNYIPELDLLRPASEFSLDPAIKAWHRRQYLDQRYLMDQGLDSTMLATALSKLPSCHEVEIRDSYCPSRGRGEERWTSYGSTEFLKSFGIRDWHWWTDSMNMHGTLNRANHVFSAVTRAMALTGQGRTYTALMMTTRDFHNGLAEDAFYVPNFPPEFSNAFKAIKTLMLQIQTRATKYDLSEFKHFLGLFPSLTHLRLNGTPKTEASEWISAAEEALISSPIRRLDLGKMNLVSSDFKDFLSSLKDLEHLEVHWVSLDGSWTDMFTELHDKKNLSHLNVIKLNSLIAGPEYHHIHIGFKSSREAVAKGPRDLRTTLECRGSDWFEEITGRLVAQDAQFLDDISGDDDVDSDHDGDSDDDDDNSDLNEDELAYITAMMGGESEMDENSDETDVDLEDDD